MLQPAPRISVLTFAVAVPASTTMDLPAFDDDYYDDDDDDTAVAAAATQKELADDFLEVPIRRNKPVPQAVVKNDTSMKGFGMVGTITICHNSYIVWFGWGKTDDTPSTSSEDEATMGRTGVNHSRIVGSTEGSASTSMGQLLIAMPPRPFPGGGAFTSPAAAAETSTSKLIGGDQDDDTMVARQMASRLGQKCHKPVLVSCNLDPTPIQSMGLDPELLHARAAALAEQRIWDLIQEHSASSS